MNILPPPEGSTALEMRQALLTGQATALELAERHIRRIEALEPSVHAWAHFDPDAVRAQARACDQALARGQGVGLLAGLPVGVKDLFDTADMPTTYGSAVYAGHRPAADADAVQAVRAAGGCIMGKTVSTEFAYFTPGPTANPWNTAHTPGGSSSGSVAAVACGMVPLALGSQTAGSVVRPASYCGVFGFKPGHGVFSMRGAKPFAPSLDTLGWFSRAADDLELMRCALAGLPFGLLPRLAPTSLQLIACRSAQWAGSEASGVQAWNQALSLCEQAGIGLRHSEIDSALGDLFEAQKQVMAFEAARSFTHELAQHRQALSPPLLQILATGQGITAQAHADALALAGRARQQVLQWMGTAHALLTPAVTGEAPQGLQATGDPMFGRVWTLLGLPCVSVPGLLGPQGLPIGMQLVGRPGGERELLATAGALHAVLTQAR